MFAFSLLLEPLRAWKWISVYTYIWKLLNWGTWLEYRVLNIQNACRINWIFFCKKTYLIRIRHPRLVRFVFGIVSFDCSNPFVPFVPQIKAQEIHVGDIVWLHDNDEIPCDLVLIGTSEPQGICYVEVMELCCASAEISVLICFTY